ncbi:MAG: dihydroorotase [Planctomycetota bacterium]
MNPLLIRGGRIVDPSQNLDRIANLLCVDGLVHAIDPGPDQLPEHLRTLDVQGHIVCPGLIDLGVELREPGFEEDETIASGCSAALAGGFTSILACSSTSPCIDSPGAVEFVRQKAIQTGLHQSSDHPMVRVHVIGCLSKDRDGEQLAELGLLREAGAVAFSDAPRPITNDALLKRALEYAGMFNVPVLNRPNVMTLSRGGVMHSGRVSLILGLRGLPTEAEDLAVARDVRMAEATSGRLHIGPVSTMGAIDLIRRVKRRGIKVTASACPHNLSQDDNELRSFDSKFKVHPPLRSRRHIDALVAAIADGTIDAIQSGHMPRAREKKMNDLDQSPFGLASLETTLASTATLLIKTGQMDWSAAIERLSTAPARIAGIPGGSLAVGQAADIAVIDPEANWTVSGQKFASLCPSTPLDGLNLTSRVEHTIVAGKVWSRGG